MSFPQSVILWLSALQIWELITVACAIILPKIAFLCNMALFQSPVVVGKKTPKPFGGRTPCYFMHLLL